jgi:hypothetical protein
MGLSGLTDAAVDMLTKHEGDIRLSSDIHLSEKAMITLRKRKQVRF